LSGRAARRRFDFKHKCRAKARRRNFIGCPTGRFAAAARAATGRETETRKTPLRAA
jgi:hypothetical protein